MFSKIPPLFENFIYWLVINSDDLGIEFTKRCFDLLDPYLKSVEMKMSPSGNSHLFGRLQKLND